VSAKHGGLGGCMPPVTAGVPNVYWVPRTPHDSACRSTERVQASTYTTWRWTWGRSNKWTGCCAECWLQRRRAEHCGRFSDNLQSPFSWFHR